MATAERKFDQRLWMKWARDGVANLQTLNVDPPVRLETDDDGYPLRSVKDGETVIIDGRACIVLDNQPR